MLNNDETETTSISMELPLLTAGRNRAKARRQTFSAYVATLLERDLAAESAAAPRNVRRASKSPQVQGQEVAL